MKTALPLALSSVFLLIIAAPATSQPYRVPNTYRVPNISGIWYMNGDEYQPCRIIQHRLDGRAEFINEHGERARGEVYGNRVFIPAWNDGEGSDGLVGVIRGELIVWPNGSYWSRY